MRAHYVHVTSRCAVSYAYITHSKTLLFATYLFYGHDKRSFYSCSHNFKSTPRRPRRQGRAGALNRVTPWPAGNLRGNEMQGLSS